MAGTKGNRIPLLIVIALLGMMVAAASPTLAGGYTPRSHSSTPDHYQYTDRLIVKYKDAATGRAAQTLSAQDVTSLSRSAGLRLTHLRRMSGSAHVLKLPSRMTLPQVRAIAQKLGAQANVLYAEPDRRMFLLAVPTDPYYMYQWNYFPYGAPDYVSGGVNLPGAWDITTGSVGIVIGLIDTGLVPHGDIDSDILDGSGRVLPGYDFISLDSWRDESHPYTANDGDGRDPDPSDPGDWITGAENLGIDETGGFFFGCGSGDSSWHGTHVAGIVAALANNALGGSGIDWNAKILPVRVLGKCGGYESDIVDGMRWAAGLTVSGVAANANPAHVLNLSLGGSGTCSATFQNAIDEIIAAGIPIVVAAGNSAGDVSDLMSPANCQGVICVAAVNRDGALASYSNYGTLVKISAPGGQKSGFGESGGIYSTVNTGKTTPVATPLGDSYQYYQGTSMAAPHVTGIISLVLALSPSLTPTEVLETLQSTARAFPTGTGHDCTTGICGAGIIDAAAAAAHLVFPAVSVSVSSIPSSTTVGTPVTHLITISNTGLFPVPATTLTATLTGTFSIVSATPSQGACSAANPVTCNFGDIGIGASATLSLTFLPEAAGTVTSVSAVETSEPNTVITNNNATLRTTIVNPVPVVTGISPSSTTAGGSLFNLTISGGNFIGSSKVHWNGSSRATSFVSSTELTATILAADIASAGTASVTVVNKAPGGGTSNALSFEITSVVSPSVPAQGSDGGGGGGCFIATAAFGSYAHPLVKVLRNFRDLTLLKHPLGRAFVQWYYRNSSPVAEFIRSSEALKACVRALLIPLAGFGYLSIHLGLLPALALSLVFMAGLCFAARCVSAAAPKTGP
ncbi:MAG: S8 family serine peptidase [Deltaproteobacteria bacterium]|nr:S8 family serine peptidase [Deltaproteobacteria bacterium]